MCQSPYKSTTNVLYLNEASYCRFIGIRLIRLTTTRLWYATNIKRLEIVAAVHYIAKFNSTRISHSGKTGKSASGN